MPLPITAILSAPDFGIRAAAIAAAGVAVALHARDRDGPGASPCRLHTEDAGARPPARSGGFRERAARYRRGHGSAWRPAWEPMTSHLPMPGECCPMAGSGARCTALRRRGPRCEEGADFLVVGSIYQTPTHPGRAAVGTRVLARGGDARPARDRDWRHHPGAGSGAEGCWRLRSGRHSGALAGG